MRSTFLLLFILLWTSISTAESLNDFVPIFKEAPSTIWSNHLSCMSSETGCEKPLDEFLDDYVLALQSFKEMYSQILNGLDGSVVDDLYLAHRNQDINLLVFNVRWYGSPASENEARIIDMMISDIEHLKQRLDHLLPELLESYNDGPIEYYRFMQSRVKPLLQGRYNRLRDFAERLKRNLPLVIVEIGDISK